ncbi:hypothetical protein A2851_05240 [Candidatus Kaiserbacteria bacterium RIFCSPHIGHO2_01_FULL_53_29]|nr:MAG: hypothetical protein A2851_05240 [Candidatus Kaiserbacteria bacterium RIFCSPHIGHO2_01_FULL_53_29]
MKMTQDELNAKLKERFKELPKVLQDAITSTDIQKQLRELADTNKLHLDQWQLLENEVLLTLMGFQPPEELADNIKADLDVTQEMAQDLASNVSRIVFQPVREQLERELEHPDARAADTTGVEDVRSQVLGEQPVASSLEPEASTNAESATSYKLQATSFVAPATPPSTSPTGKIERAPVSAAYKAGEASTVRKSVEDDPYREPPQ